MYETSALGHSSQDIYFDMHASGCCRCCTPLDCDEPNLGRVRVGGGPDERVLLAATRKPQRLVSCCAVCVAQLPFPFGLQSPHRGNAIITSQLLQRRLTNIAGLSSRGYVFLTRCPFSFPSSFILFNHRRSFMHLASLCWLSRH